MQRLGETYTEWQKRIYCENSSNLGRGISLTPQCLNGGKEYKVRVTYDGGYEEDLFYLCKECLRNLKRDCRKHGYKVRAVKLDDPENICGEK